MARIRTIKPEFFDDEDIAALSFPARLTFIGLWQQADREGRLKDRPVRLKARILPFDDVDMDALLNEIARHGFIQRYVVGDLALIQVRSFAKHQNVPPKEPASVLPSPEDLTAPQAVALHENEATSVQERKGKEGNGNGNGDSAAPLRAAAPAALVFPTVGTGPKSWALTDAQIAEWQQLYPGINVGSECRKALAWVQANQPKTAKGMPAFLVNWLNRSTARHGGAQSTTRRPAWAV